MYFTLPDLQRICPFPPSINPHYNAVAQGARAWASSFGILSTEKQRDFAASSLELLTAHMYPYAGLEGFRTCCYHVNVLVLIDDFSDDEGGRRAHAMSKSFMNAIREPAQDDGTPFAHLAKECVG